MAYGRAKSSETAGDIGCALPDDTSSPITITRFGDQLIIRVSVAARAAANEKFSTRVLVRVP